MAALGASLLATALPIVEPLIPVLANDVISLITGLIHKGAPVVQAANPVPGTGAVRFADLFVSVKQDMINAHAAGQISMLADDATIKVIIQAVVTSMKLPGNLLSSPAAPAVSPTQPGAQQITVAAGQVVTITGV